METTKKLMTKRHYKRLEEAKYETPEEEAQKVIDQADEDTRLKLKIKVSGGLKVLEAMAIESREDMIEALRKPVDER